jgi:sulfide:quinone oxidoreductase
MNLSTDERSQPNVVLNGSKPTVLIIGGGFAGLETAIRLSKKKLSVTLVSDRPQMFIYPTSIWMVTGEQGVDETLIDLQQTADTYGFAFVLGKVTEVVPKKKSAVINGQIVSADFIVLAAGAGRVSIPGIEHTRTIWGAPEDTQSVHEALADLAAQGKGRIALGFGGNPKDASAVRGGPLFEVIFNIDHMLRKQKIRDNFSLTFFAPMQNPGARMGDKAVGALTAMMDKIGVHQSVGKKISRFDEGGVVFEDNTRLDADLTIFVPAGAGHPMARLSPDFPLNEAGFIKIDGQCRVSNFDNVFAVGDIADMEGPEWRAKQGHSAVVMAKIAAETILNTVRGMPTDADYRRHVDIVCVMDTGNGAAFIKRTVKKATMVYLPIIGHWLKKAWGRWYRFTHSRLTLKPRRIARPVEALPVSSESGLGS